MFGRKSACLELVAADSPKVKVAVLASEGFEGGWKFIAPIDKLRMAWAKAWSNAGDELLRVGVELRLHVLNSCFVDVQAATLPSTVDGADDGVLGVEEKAGLAVCVLDHKREVRQSRDHRVGGKLRDARGGDADDMGTMNLVHGRSPARGEERVLFLGRHLRRGDRAEACSMGKKGVRLKELKLVPGDRAKGFPNHKGSRVPEKGVLHEMDRERFEGLCVVVLRDGFCVLGDRVFFMA